MGHIMFTKTYITLPDGSKFEVLLLALLAVLIEHRQQGIGMALVKKGFEVAKTMGFKAVLVCGDPVYYNRFGFLPVASFSIDAPQISAPYVMVCELLKDALKGITGSIRFEI